MPGSWEIPKSVLCAILHVEHVPFAWALALRKLQVPGPVIGLTGMPFDHARNAACQRALDMGVDYCFRSDVIVETLEGAKKIIDIEEGDLVKTHLGRYRPVTRLIKREYKQRSPLISVCTDKSTITCTPEHPFYVCRLGENKFIRAKDLVTTDQLLYPNKNEVMDWIKFDISFNSIGTRGDGKLGAKRNGETLGKIPVTKDIARFLGLYLAEGCGTSDGICFTFNNKEKEYIELVSSISNMLFSRKPSITTRWATNVKINVRALSKLFKNWFGRGAREKRIPKFVFNWSLRNKLNFLYGYLEGDGCLINKSGVFSYRTSSKELTKDIKKLAELCGLVVKVCTVKPTVSDFGNGYITYTEESYQGWFAKKSCEKLVDLLQGKYQGDYIKINIKNIKDKKMSYSYRDPNVYNLEVEEDESYIVDCTAVHNCFFLDSDIIAPTDTIYRLMAHRLPIVSGLYHRRSPPAGVPVMIKGGQWITTLPDPNKGENPLVEVDLVGAGCLLIQTNVLKDMPPQEQGKRWFSWMVDKGGTSEDFTFNIHAKKTLGISTYVDTTIKCRHIGLSEYHYQMVQPIDYNFAG